MRTTIDLPPDLHAAVRSVASHSRQSMNQTVAELVRRGLLHPGTEGSSEVRIDAATGLPLLRSGRMVTEEDVRALDDE